LTVAEKRGKKALFIKKLPGFPLKHIEKWGQNSIEYIDFLCFLPFPPQLSNSLAIFALKMVRTTYLATLPNFCQILMKIIHEKTKNNPDLRIKNFENA